jgi:hypothetical protein
VYAGFKKIKKAGWHMPACLSCLIQYTGSCFQCQLVPALVLYR